MSTPLKRVTTALETRIDDDVLAFVDPETDVTRESRASASDLRALVAVVEAAATPEVHDSIQDGIAEAREGIERSERLGRTARVAMLREKITRCEELLNALHTATRPRGEGEG
jgi:hypothetical protein